MKKLLLLLFLCPALAFSQTKIRVEQITSGSATDAQIIKSDGAGTASWQNDSLTTDVPFVNYDTSYVETGAEPVGTKYWNKDENTLNTVLPNGVILQDGHELFFDVLNQTGGNLINGYVAAYAGSVGVSGKIKADYMIADGSIFPQATLGIFTETISNGEQGKVTWFGKVRGIETDGVNFGETWSDGDTLWVSTTNAGWLTNTQPQAPYPAILMAIVIKAHPQVGTLEVRPTFPQKLTDLYDVNGTLRDSTGQIMVWDNARNVMDFDYNINNYWSKDEILPSDTGNIHQAASLSSDDTGILSLDAPTQAFSFVSSNIAKLNQANTFTDNIQTIYGNTNLGRLYFYNGQAYSVDVIRAHANGINVYSLTVDDNTDYINYKSNYYNLNFQSGVGKDIQFYGGGSSYLIKLRNGKVIVNNSIDDGSGSWLQVSGSINSTGYKLNSTDLLLDAHKSGSLGTPGQIYTGVDATSTPTWSNSISISGNINTTAGTFQLNGTDINTAGALSNVAYLNQANTFSNSQTINKNDGGLIVNGASGTGGYNYFKSSGKNRWVYGRHYYDDSFFIERWTGTATNEGIEFQISNSTGDATFTKTIQATTAKLTNLTNGYIPYHISDASGLGNTNAYFDGTNWGFGTTSSTGKLQVTDISRAYDYAQNDGAGSLRITTGTGLVSDESLAFGVHDGDYSWIQAVKPGAAFRNLVLQAGGGNVGIQTTSPGGLIGLKDANTYIDRDGSGNLTGTDINAGTSTLSDWIADSNSENELNDSIKIENGSLKIYEAGGATPDSVINTIFNITDGTGFLKNSAGTWSYDNSTYLTSETDPVYTASSWYTTTNNSANWNTAYGWGDHATAGYLTDAPSDGNKYGRLNGAWSIISEGTTYTGGAGIDITGTTVSMDINSLTAIVDPHQNNDYIPIYDASLGAIRKVAPTYLHGWDLYVDGSNKGSIGKSENVDFIGGTGISLGYTTANNNSITISGAYTGGTAIDVVGGSIAFDMTNLVYTTNNLNDADFFVWYDTSLGTHYRRTLGELKAYIGSGFSDPMTTAGDMIIRNASNITSRLGIGSTNNVLYVNGGVPFWGDVSSPLWDRSTLSAYIDGEQDEIVVRRNGGSTYRMDAKQLPFGSHRGVVKPSSPITVVDENVVIIDFSSYTVTFPSSPYDGQAITIVNRDPSGAVSCSSYYSIAGGIVSTIAASTSVEVVYYSAGSAWYQIN